MIPLFLVLAACPGPEPVRPTITIVSPDDGAVLPSGEVSVQVDVTDFALVAPEEEGAALTLPLWWAPQVAWAHEPSAEPEGFVRVSIDGVDTLDTIVLDFTLSDVPSGAHTVEVELHYPDGDPLFPAVSDEITVTVP